MQNHILNKEEFVSVMEDLKEANDYQQDLNAFFQKHDVDGYIFQPDCSCTVIRLLHILFGEQDENEWINYFCFDLDFGRKWKPGKVSAKGNDIRLSTPEELYDHLVHP